MRRFPVLLLYSVFFVAACHRPDPADLVETTTFELARDHGRYVRVARVNVFSITLGDGPDLVLLHGNPSSTYTWRFVIEPLAQHFRVHAFDLPGFGFSEKPPNATYTPTWLAQIVNGYMGAEGIEKAVIVGNSMGGEVATEFAALFPKQTAALVLLAPAGLPDDEPDGYPFALRIAKLPVLGPLLTGLPNRPIIAAGLRDGFHDASKVSEADVDALYLPLRTRNGTVAFFKQLEQPKLPQRADLLRMIRAPTLIIVGDDDRILSPQISHKHREVIADSELQVWERTGHLPQEEHPERVVDEILRFTAEHGS